MSVGTMSKRQRIVLHDASRPGGYLAECEGLRAAKALTVRGLVELAPGSTERYVATAAGREEFRRWEAGAIGRMRRR